MKSQVKDLTELAICIYKDATAKCAATRLEYRDIETIISRAEHEGLSFFTITLPTLGSDLERCLASGGIGPTDFRSFRKYGKIPAFLRGFFAQMFCKATGRLINEPDVSALEGLRQLAYTFKKLLSPCSPKRVRRAMEAFIKIEQDFDVPIDPDDMDEFHVVSRQLWGGIIGRDYLQPHDFLPKHGPGSTAERVLGNSKYSHQRWHERLEPYFPLLSFAFSSESVYKEKEFEDVTLVKECDEQPVRVVAVPKTLKSPRIIAIEPVCMQYAQQAIARALIGALEEHPLTAGHLNFRDQSVNQMLAMNSSTTMRYATLDLSSASDRVENTLASYMFESNPDLQEAIQACRSKNAQMPDGSILNLKKFASMGSALCFPVEAMYFYTICVMSLLKKRKLPVDMVSIRKVAKHIYVYGDDIIVPTDCAAIVIEHLQKYYCKVNTSKSFWTGKFRESCGVDAYDGENVVPTYIRHFHPNHKRDANALIGWISTSNAFYKKGYWLTSSYLIERCESILGKLPIVGPLCAGLGKLSFQQLVSSERWNKDIQVHEVRTWCAVPVYQIDRLEGYAALTKCLLSLEVRGFHTVTPTDAKHLSRTARSDAVTLKRRWTRPY